MSHDVDANHHTNNISYIRMALDFIPIDEHPNYLEIYYEKQSHYGDVLKVYRAGKDARKVIVFKKDDENVATVVFG